MPTYHFTFQAVVDGDTFEDAEQEARILISDRRFEPSSVELEAELGAAGPSIEAAAQAIADERFGTSYPSHAEAVVAAHKAGKPGPSDKDVSAAVRALAAEMGGTYHPRHAEVEDDEAEPEPTRYAYELSTGSYFRLAEDVVAVTVPVGEDVGEFLARSDLAARPSISEQLDKAPEGGFDGVVVTFGEGTDDDSVNASIFHYPRLQLTLADGSTIEADEPRATWSDDLDRLVVEYQPVSGVFDEPTGERKTFPFEQLVAVNIY